MNGVAALLNPRETYGMKKRREDQSQRRFCCVEKDGPLSVRFDSVRLLRFGRIIHLKTEVPELLHLIAINAGEDVARLAAGNDHGLLPLHQPFAPPGHTALPRLASL